MQEKYEEMEYIKKQQERNADEYIQNKKLYEQRENEFEQVHQTIALSSELLSDASQGWQGDEATLFLNQQEAGFQELYQITRLEQVKNDEWMEDKEQIYQKKELNLEGSYIALEKEG